MVAPTKDNSLGHTVGTADEYADAAAIYSDALGPPLKIWLPNEGRKPTSMVCSWRHPKLYEYEVSATNTLVIALQTAGPRASLLTPDGWCRAVPSGNVHIVLPDIPTTWKVDGNLEFLSVHIATERVRSLFERDDAELELRRRFGFHFDVRDRFLSASVVELGRELHEPGESGSLYTDMLADSMALRIFRLGQSLEKGVCRPCELSTTQLATIEALLEARLTEGISLAELAASIGVSRFHFARAFTATTGISPHRFLTVRRIERAKALLSDTELPLAQIAIEAGFNDQQHFTTRFRNLVGMTPGRYRGDRGQREGPKETLI